MVETNSFALSSNFIRLCVIKFINLIGQLCDECEHKTSDLIEKHTIMIGPFLITLIEFSLNE